MDEQVGMFAVTEQTARRYLNVGYGVALGGSAVVAAGGIGLQHLGLTGSALTVAVVVLVTACILVGGLLAATGHQMKAGNWGLRIGDDALTVVNGWRHTTIPWHELEYFTVRPWGNVRELQVRFRASVRPPRGFASGRPAGPGRPATDLTPLLQVSMLGDREAACLAELERHLLRQG